MGHFSKYIVPGSKLLRAKLSYQPEGTRTPVADVKPRPYGVCDGEFGLEATSFLRPDGQIATVVLNCGDQAITYKLRHGQYAVPGHIPGHAIQTLVYPSSIVTPGDK